MVRTAQMQLSIESGRKMEMEIDAKSSNVYSWGKKTGGRAG